MKYAVLWSGGLDSTFLIWKLLKQGNEVDAYYVNLKNNALKTKCELKAMASLTELFCQSFNHLFLNKGTIVEISLMKSATNPESSCPQLLSWIYAIPMILNSSASTPSSCTDRDPQCIAALGYVKNDCALSYLDDIRNCLAAFSGFTIFDFNRVEFPIIKYSKYDMIRELLEDKFGRRLILKTWTCETPIVENTDDLFNQSTSEIVICGKCDPCKRRKEWMTFVDVQKLEEEERSYCRELKDDSDLRLPFKTYREVAISETHVAVPEK